MKARKLYGRLQIVQELYDEAIKSIEREIEHKVDFKFFIMFQSSDGFVLVHEENCHNAPLEKCLEIIEKKGCLSYEDYYNKCI
jgi:hypothetical protein